MLNLTTAQQTEVINLVASNMEGFNSLFIIKCWGAAMLPFALIFITGLIREALQSFNTNVQEDETMINNTETQNVQEDTVNNNDNNNLTIRQKINNWFAKRTANKIEDIQTAHKRKDAVLVKEHADLTQEIEDKIDALMQEMNDAKAEFEEARHALETDCITKVELASKPGLMERAVEFGFEKAEAVKNRWSAFKQAVRAKAIEKLGAVPMEDFVLLQEQVNALETAKIEAALDVAIDEIEDLVDGNDENCDLTVVSAEMPIEELREIARDCGISFHKNWNRRQLVARINQ